MLYYEYKVSVYYEDEGKTQEETGIVAGQSYGEALSQLIEYYGENDTENVYLSCLSDSPLKVDPDQINIIREKVIW